MKKNLIIIGSIAALLFVLGISKDLAVKIAVEKGVEAVTGLRLNMSALNVSVFRSVAHIKNLKLYNPTGFKDRTMLDMPEIYVAYSLPSIIKGKVYLKEARIHLREFVVVKNEKGVLNLDSLKVVQAQKKGEEAKKAEKEGGKAPEIQIGTLRLKIEKAIYKDYTSSPYPRVMKFDINLDEEYKNIDNPYALVSLIVAEALADTTISRLTNFDIKGLEGNISDTLSTIQKVTPDALQGPVKAAKQAMQTTGVKDAAKGAVDALENVFKGTFGSGK